MTIIIGKSANLSRALASSLENVIMVSSLSPVLELKKLSLEKPINIIFNNFQKSTKLYDISEPLNYIQRSIISTVEVLEFLKKYNIRVNKILYTSSSSVYGNNQLCAERDNLNPMNLPASLKVANEKLVEAFCQENKYEYTICRLFNMYGGDDTFSIISKIIKYKDRKEILTLYNHGSAIRDYIYINDVVKIYIQLLTISNIPIVNIGTSEGISVQSIITFLKKHNIYIQYDTVEKEEIEFSTADNSLLKKYGLDVEYKNVQKYILESILKNKEE